MNPAHKEYRRNTLISLALCIILGLVSRRLPLGWLLWDKYLGDLLYAAVFYLGLSLLWPSGPLRTKIVLATLYVISVEGFQLTPIPRALANHPHILVRGFAYFVLGSVFSGWDLLAYGAGIGSSALLDRFVLKHRPAKEPLPSHC